jgi:hypothetical protein
MGGITDCVREYLEVLVSYSTRNDSFEEIQRGMKTNKFAIRLDITERELGALVKHL